MPAPDRSCSTCLHHRPYEGLLAETFGKCDSPKRPVAIRFAETLRGDDSLCGPVGVWWEKKPPLLQLVEEEGGGLDWEDEDVEED